MHTLITIPFSPYNEKARWALQRFGIAFRERGYMPMLHMPAVAWATRFGRDGKADRVSSRLSTPVLLMESGERLCDSQDIVRWVDRTAATSATTLYPVPEVEALEKEFDNGLGAHARRIAYGLGGEVDGAFAQLAKRNVGRVQYGVVRAFAPVIIAMIRKGLRIDPARVERSLEAARKIFAATSERLATARFFFEDRVTAADMAWACMASPLLLPTPDDGFGADLPRLSEVVPRARDLALELRETVAGRHAMTMFREHRRHVVTPRS